LIAVLRIRGFNSYRDGTPAKKRQSAGRLEHSFTGSDMLTAQTNATLGGFIGRYDLGNSQ
jgi:hypothetical protein